MTLSLDDQTAKIVGQGPVPFVAALDLATSSRADLYGAILGMDGEVLNLGKDRRFPTLLQRLAVTIRDERCQIPGCDSSHTRAEVHHIVEYDENGPTVVWNLPCCAIRITISSTTTTSTLSEDPVNPPSFAANATTVSTPDHDRA